MLDVLQEGESAWQFEMHGTFRSEKYKAFYSTYQPFFSIIHGIERGKWINSAYRKLLIRGYKLDTSRGFMYHSKWDELYLTFLNWLKQKFINLFPATQHQKIILIGVSIKRKLLRIK